MNEMYNQNLNSRRSIERDQDLAEIGGKFRTRGQLVDEDYKSSNGPQNANDNQNDDDDIGPMSLTINTRQFDEN